ncbi:hypothetical protein CEXT_254151 [Caerostris extrusa]|uniref:Uncharacterized protein n=1 Tax=Caerostris extrusa TaxID=172846 RepID=A0AAV4TZ38_CAEEX|nr:hypothetical protein CEXT_254151 [Caerostris extrusa]
MEDQQKVLLEQMSDISTCKQQLADMMISIPPVLNDTESAKVAKHTKSSLRLKTSKSKIKPTNQYLTTRVNSMECLVACCCFLAPLSSRDDFLLRSFITPYADKGTQTLRFCYKSVS